MIATQEGMREASLTDSVSEDMLALDHELDMLDWSAADFASANDFDMIDMLSAALDQATRQLHEKQREFRAKSTEWTAKTKERIRIQTHRLESRRARLQEQLAKQYEFINQRMNRDAKTVWLRDKISFVVGVFNACISPTVVSRFPTWVPLYYTLQCVYLLSLRYLIYKVRRWHYFIFDLCYFVNGMTLMLLWCFRSSPTLFIATYCLTNGPVAWGIVTWRNSLVFHSLDKVTSVFIHIFPALVTYSIRWLHELDLHADATPEYRNSLFPAMAHLDTMSFKDAMTHSTVAYLIWQALYFVFIVVLRREKVEKGLRHTSYTWLLDDSQGRKGVIQKLSFVFGPKYKVYVFMCLQLIYNIVTTVPTYFLFKHFWLNTFYLVVMFGATIYNGASFYIEVFSRRYIQEVESIQKKSMVSVDERVSEPHHTTCEARNQAHSPKTL